MRISNRYLYQNIQNNLENNLADIYEKQTYINNGKKYILPSDDPVASVTGIRIRENLAVNEHYQNRQNHIEPYMEVASTQVENIVSIIQQARVDVNFAANSTRTQEELDTIANNIDNYIDNILVAANTQYNNVHLFAGYNTQTTPFERSGDQIRYYGTSNYVTQDIAEGIEAKIGVPGNQLFQTHSVTGNIPITSTNEILASTMPALPAGNQFSLTIDGNTVNYTVDYATESLQDVIDKINNSSLPVNAYSVKQDDAFYLAIDSQVVGTTGELTMEDDLGGAGSGFLEAVGVASGTSIIGTQSDFDKGLLDTLIKIKSDLEGGTISTMPDYISEIDAAFENILSEEFNMNSEISRLDMVRNFSTNEEDRLKELLSDTEDIDLTEAVSDLLLSQQAYEAALSTSSRIMNLSLLNYI